MGAPPGSTSARHAAKDTADAGDRALLERISQGDRQALETMYLAYYGRLTRFLTRLTGRADLAEESLNDVMLVVWHKAADFRGESRVSTWIMGIAYRNGLKAARKAAAHATVSGVPDEAAPDHLSPERTMDADQARLWIRDGLTRLPVDQRIVVELAFFGDHSYAEIADIVGCPVNTVKTRMFHARRKLKALMPGLTTRTGARYTRE